MIIPILFAFFGSVSFGSDWLCQEEASQRHDNEIYSCGIGTGDDENSARLNAFDNAKKEFQKICELSDDCNGRQISVWPQRTACEKKGRKYQCHRLVVFGVQSATKVVLNPPVGIAATQPSESQPLKAFSASTPTARPSQSPPVKPPSPSLKEPDENFKPFRYRQISHLPKLRLGMTKEEVLKIFGKPQTKMQRLNGFSLVFEGKMCALGICFVNFDSSGRVTGHDNFNLDYTEDLK
jgi:hypothetical protein